MRVLPYLAIISGLLSVVYAAPKPVKNLHVTFVGRNFDVESATTVEEVQKEVQKQAGVGDETKLPQVIFGGKNLQPTAFLRDAGVTDGANLNMIPDASSAMKEMMEKAGVDSDQLEEMMKSMGGEDGKMPSLQESMEMMSGMVNSPIFQEYMNDPERLEQSRQMILNNPMLKSMMAGMPGMEELLNDPDAWRDSMKAAASMYKSMDPDQLMNAMMGNAGSLGGLGDLGGAGGGLFDGTLDDDKNSNKAAAAALDELSEGDD